jgi:hypothetical protein
MLVAFQQGSNIMQRFHDVYKFKILQYAIHSNYEQISMNNQNKIMQLQ